MFQDYKIVKKFSQKSLLIRNVIIISRLLNPIRVRFRHIKLLYLNFLA